MRDGQKIRGPQPWHLLFAAATIAIGAIQVYTDGWGTGLVKTAAFAVLYGIVLVVRDHGDRGR